MSTSVWGAWPPKASPSSERGQPDPFAWDPSTAAATSQSAFRTLSIFGSSQGLSDHDPVPTVDQESAGSQRRNGRKLEQPTAVGDVNEGFKELNIANVLPLSCHLCTCTSYTSYSDNSTCVCNHGLDRHALAGSGGKKVEDAETQKTKEPSTHNAEGEADERDKKEAEKLAKMLDEEKRVKEEEEEEKERERLEKLERKKKMEGSDRLKIALGEKDMDRRQKKGEIKFGELGNPISKDTTLFLNSLVDKYVDRFGFRVVDRSAPEERQKVDVSRPQDSSFVEELQEKVTSLDLARLTAHTLGTVAGFSAQLQDKVKNAQTLGDLQKLVTTYRAPSDIRGKEREEVANVQDVFRQSLDKDSLLRVAKQTSDLADTGKRPSAENVLRVANAALPSSALEPTNPSLVSDPQQRQSQQQPSQIQNRSNQPSDPTPDSSVAKPKAAPAFKLPTDDTKKKQDQKTDSKGKDNSNDSQQAAQTHGP